MIVHLPHRRTGHLASRRRPVLATFTLVALVLGGGACSDTPGSTEAFCAQVRQVPSLESVLSRFAEADASVLQDRIDKARSAYEDLASAAPSSIAEDAEAVVALVDDVLAAVEAHPDDPAKAADELRAAMDEHPDVEASRSVVARFAADECDVVLDAPLTD